MLKRIKIINENTKQVLTMSEKSNQAWAVQNGFSADLHDCEQAYNGNWYLTGYAPAEPEKTYTELRVAEYPSIQEQLDMQYWDSVNGTTNWKDTISAIKEKYPKE